MPQVESIKFWKDGQITLTYTKNRMRISVLLESTSQWVNYCNDNSINFNVLDIETEQ